MTQAQSAVHGSWHSLVGGCCDGAPAHGDARGQSSVEVHAQPCLTGPGGWHHAGALTSLGLVSTHEVPAGHWGVNLLHGSAHAGVAAAASARQVAVEAQPQSLGHDWQCSPSLPWQAPSPQT